MLEQLEPSKSCHRSNKREKEKEAKRKEERKRLSKDIRAIDSMQLLSYFVFANIFDAKTKWLSVYYLFGMMMRLFRRNN